MTPGTLLLQQRVQDQAPHWHEIKLLKVKPPLRAKLVETVTQSPQSLNTGTLQVGYRTQSSLKRL